MEIVDNHMQNKANTIVGFFKEHIKEMLLFLACDIFLFKVTLYSFEIKEKNTNKPFIHSSAIKRVQSTASSKGSFNPTSLSWYKFGSDVLGKQSYFSLSQLLVPVNGYGECCFASTAFAAAILLLSVF